MANPDREVILLLVFTVVHREGWKRRYLKFGPSRTGVLLYTGVLDGLSPTRWGPEGLNGSLTLVIVQRVLSFSF